MEEWTAGVYCLLLLLKIRALLASFCVMNNESSAFLMWPWWLLCGYAVMRLCREGVALCFLICFKYAQYEVWGVPALMDGDRSLIENHTKENPRHDTKCTQIPVPGVSSCHDTSVALGCTYFLTFNNYCFPTLRPMRGHGWHFVMGFVAVRSPTCVAVVRLRNY